MDPLLPVVRTSISTPASEDTQFLAETIRKRLPMATAIVTYGSTLRGVRTRDTLIDYYVIADSLHAVEASTLMAVLGEAIPPNVFYIEAQRGDVTLRAKYAVVSLPTLKRRVQLYESNPYFWARFAQPMALVWCRDEATKVKLLECIVTAIHTAYAFGLPLANSGKGLDVWRALFARTYKTEFRPEGTGRSDSIVDQNAEYFRRVSGFLGDAPSRQAFWPWIMIKGKALTVLRLAKAAYTFSGGADYVAWKIERHTGEKIVLSDWQRRHPLAAGLMLLPRLWRKGLVR
jgi:hypothetical protein